MKSKFDMIPGNTPSPRRIKYASKDASSSNNLTPVLQPEMCMFSRTPSQAVGNYKVSHNAESTGLCTSSTKGSTNNQLPIRVVRPVRMTNKKFAHELYGKQQSQSNYSCVNKTAERQVPFPRLNRTSMCVGVPAGRYGDTARRIPPRPWMRTDQSASSISSQAARTHSANQRHACRRQPTNQKRATLDPSAIKAAVVLSSSVLLTRTVLLHRGTRCHQLDIIDTSAIEHSSSTSVREGTTCRAIQFDARLRE